MPPLCTYLFSHPASCALATDSLQVQCRLMWRWRENEGKKKRGRARERETIGVQKREDGGGLKMAV